MLLSILAFVFAVTSHGADITSTVGNVGFAPEDIGAIPANRDVTAPLLRSERLSDPSPAEGGRLSRSLREKQSQSDVELTTGDDVDETAIKLAEDDVAEARQKFEAAKSFHKDALKALEEHEEGHSSAELHERGPEENGVEADADPLVDALAANTAARDEALAAADATDWTLKDDTDNNNATEHADVKLDTGVGLDASGKIASDGASQTQQNWNTTENLSAMGKGIAHSMERQDKNAIEARPAKAEADATQSNLGDATGLLHNTHEQIADVASPARGSGCRKGKGRCGCAPTCFCCKEGDDFVPMVKNGGGKGRSSPPNANCVDGKFVSREVSNDGGLKTCSCSHLLGTSAASLAASAQNVPTPMTTSTAHLLSENDWDWEPSAHKASLKAFKLSKMDENVAASVALAKQNKATADVTSSLRDVLTNAGDELAKVKATIQNLKSPQATPGAVGSRGQRGPRGSPGPVGGSPITSSEE